MSDDLMKRLRGWPSSLAANVMQDAADRIEALQAEMDAAVLAEREACADVVTAFLDSEDGWLDHDFGKGYDDALKDVLAAIRARSNGEPGQ